MGSNPSAQLFLGASLQPFFNSALLWIDQLWRLSKCWEYLIKLERPWWSGLIIIIHRKKWLCKSLPWRPIGGKKPFVLFKSQKRSFASHCLIRDVATIFGCCKKCIIGFHFHRSQPRYDVSPLFWKAAFASTMATRPALKFRLLSPSCRSELGLKVFKF